MSKGRRFVAVEHGSGLVVVDVEELVVEVKVVLDEVDVDVDEVVGVVDGST